MVRLIAALLASALSLVPGCRDDVAPVVPLADPGLDPELRAHVRLLAAEVQRRFEGVRDESTRAQRGADASWGIAGWNACGERSRYGRVWHFVSVDGTFEYVCDVDFPNTLEADGWFDAMHEGLAPLVGWGAERASGVRTLREVEGALGAARVLLQTHRTARGIEAELWIKPTPATRSE